MFPNINKQNLLQYLCALFILAFSIAFFIFNLSLRLELLQSIVFSLLLASMVSLMALSLYSKSIKRKFDSEKVKSITKNLATIRKESI